MSHNRSEAVWIRKVLCIIVWAIWLVHFAIRMIMGMK